MSMARAGLTAPAYFFVDRHQAQPRKIKRLYLYLCTCTYTLVSLVCCLLIYTHIILLCHIYIYFINIRCAALRRMTNEA